MTRRYRKKPIVIEAWQWTGQPRQEWPIWLQSRFNDIEVVATSHGAVLVIPTLEGDHQVQRNDWIIRGVKGEIYPCKPDIFEQTYELVE